MGWYCILCPVEPGTTNTVHKTGILEAYMASGT